MDFLNKRECHLCGIIIKDENFEEINDVIKEILGILLIELTFDNEAQHVTCKVCYAKLSAASNFKSTCLHSNNTIIHYVDFENSKPVDLKGKDNKEKRSTQGNSMSKNQEICRLCLQPTDGKHKSMQDVPSKTFEIYIPEINFVVTTDSTICLKCIDDLGIHTAFVQKCLDIEANRNMKEIKVRDILMANPCVKTEEIEIKSEETEEEEILFETANERQENVERASSVHSRSGTIDAQENKCQYNSDDLKQTERNLQSTGAKVQRFECLECDYRCTQKNYLTRHQLKHRDPSEVPMYKCDKCKFETKRRNSLKTHLLSHRDPSEVPVFKCDECDYKSIRKSNLITHKLRHKDPSEVRTYVCDECDYKSTQKNHFKGHKLKHKDPLHVLMYKCDECKFETKYGKSLKRHQLTHKDPSEVPIYGCAECDFKSIQKSNLERHRLKHKNPSEVQMFVCGDCEYKTANKPSFNVHLLKHKDASEVQMYRCDKCKYETYDRKYLKRHLITHKDPSERPMFRCDQCDYQSIQKNHFQIHQLKHKGPSV